MPETERDYEHYFGTSIEESAKFASLYERIAEERGCHFFDAGTVSKPSPLDGCHLDAENTRALGVALGPHVRKILDLS